MPQSVCLTNATSRVPSSRCEITSERSASRALPPALRMRCASPSCRPKNRDGSRRASMHVTTATPRAGVIGRSPLANRSAYAALLCTRSSMADIGQRSCSRFAARARLTVCAHQSARVLRSCDWVEACAEMLQRLHMAARWLEQMPLALSLLAIAIAAAVSWLMADAAGLHAVARVIRRAEPEWLALLLGARAVSYGGYTLAHRTTLTPGDQRKVPISTVLKTVAFGAAATSLEGGFSIDRRALRGVGATDRQATVAVLNLGALELATLAPAAWICSLTLLDTPRVQEGVTLPWAIGVPAGVALALLAVWKLSPRSLAREGAVERALGHALEALQLLLEQVRRAPRCLEGWVG